MNIIKYPNKILRQKSRKVTNITSPEIQEFIFKFNEAMIKNDGVGLAANQVDRDLRIVAVNTKDGAQIFINPFVYWKSFKRNQAEEGCLSFPGVFGLVKRSKKVSLLYRDENGKIKHLKAEGLLATVLQHEIDHLNGVLFIDKIFKYTKGEEKVEEWKKNAQANVV